MDDRIAITIDGREVEVLPGTLVAAALLNAGVSAFRTSTTGTPRAPLCGMGTCFECRVEIVGRGLVRSCGLTCESGMEIRTHA